MSEITEAIVNSTHPVYDDNIDLWQKNERRYYGGDQVVQEELQRFEWEEEDGDHFTARLNGATYINFPARTAKTVVGHLSRKAPLPGRTLNFGSLGDVDMAATGTPSQATMLWKNADAKGAQGTPWNLWWDAVQERTMVTGHRWVMVEAPSAEGAVSVAEEQAGARPFLVEYSPTSVPNWRFGERGLNWILFKTSAVVDSVVDGEYEQQVVDRFYFHCRKGYATLDHSEFTFSTGGWWKFDEDGELIEDEETGPQTGTYERTGGVIPVTAFYYKRADSTSEHNQISKPGLTELGQIASAYMNLGSAGDNDGIEGGSRTLYVLGIDTSGHGKVVAQKREGSRLIGVPNDRESNRKPTMYDSASNSAASAIEKRQERKLQEAKVQASEEVSIIPGESGISKERTFEITTSPVLAMMAEEREAAERNCIHLLEQRWVGGEPSGNVEWERDFDLTSVLQAINEVLEILEKTGATSATLSSEFIKTALQDRGFLAGMEEGTLDTVAAEVRTSLEAQQRLQDALGGIENGPSPTDDGESDDGADEGADG